MTDRTAIMAAIQAERERQDAQWGRRFPGRSLDRWLTILTEEVGEVAEAILEDDPEGVYRELVQVAAVAVKILEYTDLMEGEHG